MLKQILELLIHVGTTSTKQQKSMKPREKLGCGETLTFFQGPLFDGLSHWEDGFDEYAHAALRWIDPAHHAEAETLLSRALLELVGQIK